MLGPFFLKELVPYSKEYLETTFKLSKFKLSELLDDLLERKIIKKIGKDLIVFRYVGLLEFSSSILFVYPKYIQRIDLNKSLQLIRVLSVYSKRENLDYTELDTLGISTSNNDMNLIPLVDFFHKDYFENGLFSSQKQIYKLNGHNEIDWDKTIDETYAYKFNENLVYLNYFTKEFASNELNIITLVHKQILRLCSNYLQKSGLSYFLEYEPISFIDEEIDLNSNIIFLLNQELKVQYNDRNIILILNMINFINRNNSNSSKSSIRVFGTRYFHIVWEKICSYVFSNNVSLIQKEIDKPIWEDKYGNKLTSKRTLTPDIVTDFAMGDERYLAILDAKYYNLSFEKSKFEDKNPKLEDVTKQYLYEMALKNYSISKDLSNKINAFLVPKEGQEFVLSGKVSLGFMRELGINDIDIHSIPAEYIYNLYISNKKISTADMYDILVQR
ncbi:LlaJI family restriction endonuclease [Alkalicoccobacillus gibsonii]|uniref:LlaJI family restriction endonuclease n=1 Tax=Alkalicoccobacillus gibsonii TaxID=79881 RepID=UPI0019332D74|nr:LlaJI family restriction endonuclease [Alkalicoccobacillus gibsonii]MBM0066770.1 LlaJI family restriction endonuclease [Alkalicoccobacillus gibsonii]